ncbi:MAG: DNA polymerase III subunit delta [Pseudomonadota bacterium]
MAQKRAHEVDSFIRRPDPKYRAFLIYGPDRGLVSERAAALSAKVDVDLSDDFNVVRLDAAAIREDPARLLDEINAIALFGGDRLVWLRGAGNEKAITDAFAAISKDPPANTTLIVEAGDLKKSASLRKAAEAGSATMALPCYGDDGRNIHALIDEELGRAGLKITGAARRILAENLGGDRLASRSELQKLALYCHGRETVGEDDVVAATGDASSLTVDSAVECVLNGDLAGLDHALSRIVASKTGTPLVLQACLRQFQMVDAIRAAIEQQRQPTSKALGEYGRRIHFSRKPALEHAVRIWSSASTEQVLQHLHKAVHETRLKPAIQDSIARQALLAIAMRSKKLNRQTFAG